MKKRLLNIVLAIIMLASVFVPAFTAIPQKVDARSGADCAAWTWHSSPVGGRDVYSVKDWVPQSVMNQAIALAVRDAVNSNGRAPHNDAMQSGEWIGDWKPDTTNSGLVGVEYQTPRKHIPASTSDGGSDELYVPGVGYYSYNGKYRYTPSFQCQDLVEVFLRDYVGFKGSKAVYNDPSSGVGDLSSFGFFRVFAKKSGSLGIGECDSHYWMGVGSDYTSGTHPVVVVPESVRTKQSGETTDQLSERVRQWFIQQETRTDDYQLRKGALVFWWDNELDRIHHVAIYVGGGRVLESSGGQNSGVHNIKYISGKGIPFFYINITSPEPQTGKVKLIKQSTNPDITNNNKCYDLAGCKFKLTKADDSSVTVTLTIAKDSSGKYTATSGDLAPGEYKIREIEAGKGFKLNTDVGSVWVEAGKTKVYAYTPSSSSETRLTILGNQPLNDPLVLVIKKVNSQGESVPLGNAKLEGAQFKINYYDEILDPSSVTYNSSGVITGKTVTRTWTLQTDKNGIADFTEQYKFAGDDFYLDDAGNPRVPLGTITIQEINAPDGFIKDDSIKIYVIKDENGAISSNIPNVYTLPNTPREGQIEIEKFEVDFEDGRIPEAEAYAAAIHEKDAKFEVRLKSSGELYDTLVTDESGYAISKKLPIGTYTVKQIEGREGTEYVEPFDVTIEFSQSDIDNGVEYKLYSYKFPDNPLYNAYIYGKIKVIKIDATTQEVIKKAGVTFMIRPTEDIVVCGVVKYEKDKFIEINGVNEFVTNDEGIIEMPGLPLGNYELVETKTVAPYIKLNEPVPVTISPAGLQEGEGYLLTEIENKEARGQIILHKEGEMLVGTTDEAISTDLVVEKGLVAKHPVIETRRLAGVKFELVAAEEIKDGKNVRPEGYSFGTKTTNSDGTITFDDLPLGKYNLIEREVPVGYVLDETPIPVELKYKGESVAKVIETAEATNALKKAHVHLVKYEEEMEVVDEAVFYEDKVEIVEEVHFIYTTENLAKGFVFGLYNASELPIHDGTSDASIPANTLLDYAVSDENGNVVFDGKYPACEYYVKEIETVGKEKYKINEDVLDFTNIVDDPVLEVVDVDLDKMINWYKTKEVLVNKTDITGEEGLPGAVLEIINEDGTVIYRAETNEAGELDELELIPGKYTIHEVFAPEGYALSEDTVEFEVIINENGELEIVGSTTMKDELTKFKFIKVDEKGKSLAGAEFTMYILNTDDESGEETLTPIMVSVSSEDGTVTFEGFGIGNYIIKETLAPEGYQMSDETITLEVTREWLNKNSYAEDGSFVYSITNIAPPKTGLEMSTGSIVAIAVGSTATLALIGAGIYLFLRKKRFSTK